uniref:galactose-specific lectin nattectin-like n=1 Tax=Scatophagus argus TaxID=75038 RepID=UPI001ED845CE|nr:galactose-specific lectin nattectin-like [Scatophagus argus]
MRPAVILLLVCVLFMATVEGRRRLCHHPDPGSGFCGLLLNKRHSSWNRVSCDHGWFHLSQIYCFKIIRTPKTFDDAQKLCRSLNANLLSLHSRAQMTRMKSLANRAGIHGENVWIGARRTGGRIDNIDGSKLNFVAWIQGQPNYNGGKNCIFLNFSRWFLPLATAGCSTKMFFACSKKK